jgi:hypothetical protein
MGKIESLFKQKRISRVIEDEKSRYLNFFSKSYRENFEHCKFNLKKFPRWSIISGYYAMHDITKLFLADKFGIKIDFKVHQTTIEVLEEVLKNKEIINMLNLAYNEFLKLLNDLAEAHDKRTNAQYYTGTAFMKEKYRKEALKFFNEIVVPYIKKIKLIKFRY